MTEFPKQRKGELITVDKGVPLEPRRLPTRFPYAELEIGDSFFVKDRTPSQMAGSRQWAQMKFPGHIFVSRKVEGGCRMWRIQ